jgi:hypothetical protein
MTRRPKPIEAEPPWMRLGPAADAPDEGDDGERLWKRIAESVKPLKETKHKRHALPSSLAGEASRAKRTTADETPPAAGRIPSARPRP